MTAAFGEAFHLLSVMSDQRSLSAANNISIIDYMFLYLLSKTGYGEIVENYRE